MRAKWNVLRQKWQQGIVGMRDTLWRKAKRLVPPGFPLERERAVYIAGLVLAGLQMLIVFFMKWKVAYGNLYEWVDGEKVFHDWAMMPGFLYLMDDTEGGFLLLAVLVFLAVFWHYSYYYQESKSIYVMKRLPNRMEIHKRAWVLPLMAELGLLLSMVVMSLFCLFLYFALSPENYIPEEWLFWVNGGLNGGL